jgi:hypothetical protein
VQPKYRAAERACQAVHYCRRHHTSKTAADTEIAVTECNVNLAMDDPNACNSNPADVGKSGGPAITPTSATGNATLGYWDRVSS